MSPVTSDFSSDDERYASFARGIDAIGSVVRAQLGAPDVAYIRKVRARSRKLEILGRFLLQVSIEPASFGLGVLALALHKQLETAEIGHTVLHGTYDHLAGAEKFRSESFRWKFPVDEASWKTAHNIRHHQYANVAGRDPDLDFGVVRLSPHIPYRRSHALQPYSGLATWLFFGLSIQAQATGILDLYFHRDAGAKRLRGLGQENIRNVHRLFARKVLRYYGREFLLFPFLAGPFFPKVLVGNLLSEVMRDIYSGATIYCGHVDATGYAPQTRARSRGEWYAMQVEAARDFEVSRPLSVLCGGLDRQIEHHLFPRFPPERLRRIAPRVRAVCAEHGVRYRTDSWPRTLKATLRTLRALAKPSPDAQGPSLFKGAQRTAPATRLGPS